MDDVEDRGKCDNRFLALEITFLKPRKTLNLWMWGGRDLLQLKKIFGDQLSRRNMGPTVVFNLNTG